MSMEVHKAWGQGPEDCSKRMDQQQQKPGSFGVGEVVRAVDFAERNGDVSGWTQWTLRCMTIQNVLTL